MAYYNSRGGYSWKKTPSMQWKRTNSTTTGDGNNNDNKIDQSAATLKGPPIKRTWKYARNDDTYDEAPHQKRRRPSHQQHIKHNQWRPTSSANKQHQPSLNTWEAPSATTKRNKPPPSVIPKPLAPSQRSWTRQEPTRQPRPKQQRHHNKPTKFPATTTWKRPAAPPQQQKQPPQNNHAAVSDAADQSKDRGTNETLSTPAEQQSSATTPTTTESLQKRGRHKLISESALAEASAKAEAAFKARLAARRKKKYGARVELKTGETTKLTDFSYRTAGSNTTKLFRVQQDAKTTPICSAFLRGLECTKPNCTFRHDVPKDATIPVCSFFQRNGMCTKREACPFRHVKVNPHAMVCPSFKWLGFCEDADCPMKHIREGNKKQQQQKH